MIEYKSKKCCKPYYTKLHTDRKPRICFKQTPFKITLLSYEGCFEWVILQKPKLLLVNKSKRVTAYKGTWFLLSLSWQLRVNVQQYKIVRQNPCSSVTWQQWIERTSSLSSQSPIPSKASEKHRKVWHINYNTIETFAVITCPTQRIMPPHEEKLALLRKQPYLDRCSNSWWDQFTILMHL